MIKEKYINQISNILDVIISDGIISPNEINILQDWIDENSVYFIGDDYNLFIIPLQKFIEDGQLTKQEIDDIKEMLKRRNKIEI